MRVAMVGPFGMKPKGTMAVRALPLAKSLVRQGYQVALFVPPWSWAAHSGRVYEEEGVRIENTTIRPAPLILPRMIAAVRKFRPDVIHFFKPKAYSGLSAFAFWQMQRVGFERARMVLDSDDWEGAGGWNELERYTSLQKRFFSFQEGWGLDHNQAITVASRALEGIAWSRGRLRQSVYYLPNGYAPPGQPDVSASDDVRSALRLSSSPTVLLYTRFVEFGVERIAIVFRRLAQLVPGVQFLVVGKGLHEEEQTLLTLVSGLANGAKVEYVGWVDAARLPAYFSISDAAIYPMDDTLINRCKCPVKLVDLMGAGLPVVADAVGQAREYIMPGESGILVKPGDTELMVCAAAELLSDPARRKRLGDKAATTIRTDYSWDRLVEIAEAAYEGRQARVQV